MSNFLPLYKALIEKNLGNETLDNLSLTYNVPEGMSMLPMLVDSTLHHILGLL